MIATIAALGLVNWIATCIIVDAELTRPCREWVECRRHEHVVWDKLAYLVSCHLCAGTWVGIVTALVVTSVWPSWTGVIASGLAYKAVGHLTLEASAVLQKAAR